MNRQTRAVLLAGALSLSACGGPMVGLYVGPGFKWEREGTSVRDTNIAMMDCAEAVPDSTCPAPEPRLSLQQVIDARGACMRAMGFRLISPSGSVIEYVM